MIEQTLRGHCYYSNYPNWLFRRGTGHTEKDFLVDEELVVNMVNHNLRVHDLVDKLRELGYDPFNSGGG